MRTNWISFCDDDGYKIESPLFAHLFDQRSTITVMPFVAINQMPNQMYFVVKFYGQWNNGKLRQRPTNRNATVLSDSSSANRIHIQNPIHVVMTAAYTHLEHWINHLVGIINHRLTTMDSTANNSETMMRMASRWYTIFVSFLVTESKNDCEMEMEYISHASNEPPHSNRIAMYSKFQVYYEYQIILQMKIAMKRSSQSA